jgi:hypothetical protein
MALLWAGDDSWECVYSNADYCACTYIEDESAKVLDNDAQLLYAAPSHFAESGCMQHQVTGLLLQRAFVCSTKPLRTGPPRYRQNPLFGQLNDLVLYTSSRPE